MEGSLQEKSKSVRFIVSNYVKTWEKRCYTEGIPDEVPREIFDMVPSYKKICIALMKNDLSIIGIERPKSKYYNALKHIELIDRGVINSRQLTLF